MGAGNGSTEAYQCPAAGERRRSGAARPVRYTRAAVSASDPGRNSSTPHPEPIELVLYVSTQSAYTPIAIRNCQQLLSRFDPSRLRFEVCDVSREPERAEADAVCYTPMLLKRSPAPRTYIVGNLANLEAVAALLEASGLEPIQ